MSNLAQTFQSIEKDRSLSGKFSRAAAGKEVKFREECEFAKQIISQNNKMLDCTQKSIKDAIYTVAVLGLSLNKVNSYCYLTPRNICVEKDAKGKPVRWETQCVLIPGYRGLIKLADDSGVLSHIAAEVVYEKDAFDFELGSHPRLIHKPYIMGERGKRLGAYCVTTLLSGEKQITFVPEADLMKIRAKAETTAVWDAWPDEMAKKSAIRRAYKQWPKALRTPALTAAKELMDRYEGITIDQHEEQPPSIEGIDDEQVMQLEAIGADFGFDPGFGLDKVLSAYNVQTPAALPAHVFGEAKERLQSFCEKAQKRLEESAQ